MGAVIALNMRGEFGAACHGLGKKFLKNNKGGSNNIPLQMYIMQRTLYNTVLDLFLYSFGGLECVGHYFFPSVAIASEHATNFATQPTKLTTTHTSA
jgi:hypothetical protein